MIRSAMRRTERRRGVTLVETSVLMTAVAAMLGICALMLGLSMRLQADGLESFGRSETLGRLAARFRNDVHSARAVAIDGQTLRLDSGRSRVVEYRVDEEGVIGRAEIADGKEISRDPFRIPESAGVRVAVRDEEGRRFAVLEVDVQRRRDRIDPIRTWEVAALAGRALPPATREGGRP